MEFGECERVSKDDSGWQRRLSNSKNAWGNSVLHLLRTISCVALYKDTAASMRHYSVAYHQQGKTSSSIHTSCVQTIMY